MASVTSSLARIKQDLQRFLPVTQIESACHASGYHWRERKFGPVLTLQLFVLQILHFNTAIRHLRLLAGMSINASAYCKARMRLPLAVVSELLRRSSAAMRVALLKDAGPTALWHDHRVFLVDGSSTMTPDTPQLQKAFSQPKGQKKGCGFPVPKVLGLFDACTGLIVELMTFTLYVHEQSKVWLLHPLLQAGDVIVGDRGLCSYVHAALLSTRQVFCVFRMHQQTTVNFRAYRKSRKQLPKKSRKGTPGSVWVRRLGAYDQLVKWQKGKAAPRWMSAEQFAALPGELLVRELRYWVSIKGQRTRVVTIVTTLLDEKLYPKETIAELYGIRWRIETHWNELKTTLKMRKIKCCTEKGVRKELAIYALVFNLVHAVMMRAALRQRVEMARISFVDAVRWLISAVPGEELTDLIVNPNRPNRYEPRVLKDRRDGYKSMTQPRSVLRRKLELGRTELGRRLK